MSCMCMQAGEIMTCTTNLTVGVTELLNTELVVLIENVTTERINSFDTISDGSGIISIDVSDYVFNPGQLYQISVQLADAGDLDAAIDFSIGTYSGSCVEFTTKPVYNNNNDIIIDHISTLKIKEGSIDPSDGGCNDYIQVSADYTVTECIITVGVTDTSIPRTITVDPATYPAGQLLTIKDESGNAATNNITIDSQFEGGVDCIIDSNNGSKTIYSNGIDTMYIISDI